MKKCIKLAALSLVAFATLAGCDNSNNNDELTVGLIALHDENSTYDKNFIDAFNAACKAEGVKGLLKTGVPETTAAYDKATDLVESGCKFVLAPLHCYFCLETSSRSSHG